jgi:hypothetical protein
MISLSRKRTLSTSFRTTKESSLEKGEAKKLISTAINYLLKLLIYIASPAWFLPYCALGIDGFKMFDNTLFLELKTLTDLVKSRS